MKHILQNSVSIAANSTNTNILAGTRMEIIPADMLLDIYCTGSALGLQVEIFVAGENPIQKSAINTQNRFPVIPDDLLADDIEAYAGDKLQVSVTNTTAGALTFFYRLEGEEVEAYA